jgi:Domain of unknown function (DUF5071)
MQHAELSSLLPKSKLDTEQAEAIVRLGFPIVTPVLAELLEWLQDINWPVAQVFAPFLASIGAPLHLHIKKILETDDGMWKYSILLHVVAQSRELQDLLTVELDQIAYHPKPDEREDEVDEIAREILGGR